MHRIDGPGVAPGNLFTDGDPTSGTPATVCTDTWLNAVQEEICNVVTGAGLALSKPDNTQLVAAIRALIATAQPSGLVAAFARSTAPAGWLKCNGAAVSRTTYAALFAAIGTTFGAGNGSSTFNLPDLRGEFVRGFDDGRGVDASRAFGSAQAHEFEAHSHKILADNGGFNTNPNDVVSGTDRAAIYEAATSTVGGSETRPRNVALLYCIKT